MIHILILVPSLLILIMTLVPTLLILILTLTPFLLISDLFSDSTSHLNPKLDLDIRIISFSTLNPEPDPFLQC